MENQFNVAIATRGIINYIKSYFESTGGDTAVIGISGGVDSSVVATLCTKALGKDKVIGVLMPDGSQADIDYSYMLCGHLDIGHIVFDIGRATNIIKEDSDFRLSSNALINMPARMRMLVLMTVAQSLNAPQVGRVSCNCNLSEDMVGYSTLFGDGLGQFAPISHYTKTEVVQIAEYLKLPTELAHKMPIDGLCGKSDEENLGFTYAVLDKYIRTGVCEDAEIKKQIDKKYQANKFKAVLMPIPNYYKDNLPNYLLK